MAAILDDAVPNHSTLFDLVVDPPALLEEHRRRVLKRTAVPALQRPDRLLLAWTTTILPLLDFSPASALLVGQHKARLRCGGATVSDADVMIAAIALAQRATLVIGNARHYQRPSGWCWRAGRARRGRCPSRATSDRIELTQPPCSVAG